MLKTIITRKSDDVITNIALVSELKENGLKVDNEYIVAGIDSYNVYSNVETADTIVVSKYKYTVLGGFIVDTNYVEVVVQPTNQEVINGQLVLMDVMATMYEDMKAKGTV